MKLYSHPDKADWPAILQRPVMEVESLESVVQSVLDEVQQKGDEALRVVHKAFGLETKQVRDSI